MSNHDFGVPLSSSTPARPAYSLGSDVTASPIVDDDVLVKSVAMISYIF